MLLLVAPVHDVWNSQKKKVFQHQGYLRKSPSWFYICSSAFSCLNGLQYNILHMQPFKEICLESIPKAPHTPFLTRRGRVSQRKARNLFVKCTNWIALDHLTRPELFCSRSGKESQRHCYRQVMHYHYMYSVPTINCMETSSLFRASSSRSRNFRLEEDR